MGAQQIYRVPLVLTPQPEGGYTVISPALPGLVTEGDTLQEALINAEDALAATIEAYADLGRSLPPSLLADTDSGTIEYELLVPAR
ncbi:MAG: type II toxin-antitoxin system HicB family antitoxin [Chloroflexota bacterium]